MTFLILSLVATSALQAKPTDPVPKGKVPFIQEAQVDFDVAVECPDSGTIASDTLTITGIGLGLSGGPSPVISDLQVSEVQQELMAPLVVSASAA